MKTPEFTGRLPRLLQQFLAQSAIWTTLCFACEAVCRFVLHWGYPYDYPATPVLALFADFRGFFWKFATFHSRAFFSYEPPLMYPAPVVVCYKLLLLKPGSLVHPRLAVTRFLCLVLLTSWVMLWSFRKSLIRRGLRPSSANWFAAVTYLLSFPLFFEIHQLNLEIILWVIVTLGIAAFWTGKPWLASILFGLAGAMKIFPFVFLGLFLIRKQYREIALSLVTAVAVTIPCLWLVCPDIAFSWRQTNAALDHFRSMYMLTLRPIETGFDHSLFCLLKRSLPTLPNPITLGHILTAYLALAALLGIILFFVRIRKLPVVNQILCLSIAAILLPPTSYEYTLLHLYAPFVLLLFIALERAASGRETDSRDLLLAFSLFAFLFSVQSEFILHGVRFAGQLKAIALILLSLLALLHPFEINEETPRVASVDLPPQPAYTLTPASQHLGNLQY